jgi:simple sugar transport system permease protein
VKVASWEGHLEERIDPSRTVRVCAPLVALLAALLIGAIPLLVSGSSVAEAYDTILRSSFGGSRQITGTLFQAAPLVFTGLAASVAFSVRLWNIGAEGQLVIGAIVASAAALALVQDVPPALAITVLFGAGAVGGALFALVAGVLRARFGANEILLTLMLNFVALYLVRYLILGSHSYWRDPESPIYPRGKSVPASAWTGPILGSSVELGFVIATGVAIVVWFVMRYTTLGFSMRVIASSAAAARYAGISERRLTLVVMAASGALAGMAGAVLLGGSQGEHGLVPQNLEGYGFNGIVVAALARLNPLATVPMALLVGGISQAALDLQFADIPPGTGRMLQGTMLLCALVAELLVRRRLVIGRVAPAS